MAIAERRLPGISVPRAEIFPSSPSIFTHGNGIDLAYPYPDGSRGKTYRYEDKCFREISENAKGQTLILGPYLIDTFFSAELKIMTRPDAMSLQRNKNEFVLKELYEFKHGDFGLTKKLNGFESFLDKIRRGGYLERMLQTLKKEELEIPVVVPSNQDILVTFVSPRSAQETPKMYEYSRFRRVNYLQVA